MIVPIIFNSGIPRSGSTLLQNLLAQAPFLYCTPTSDMVDIICHIRDKWMQLPSFMAQGLRVIEPRVVGMLRGAIGGFYDREFSVGKWVVDKSRAHLSKIELLETILGRQIKIIVPVRDIRDVVASFEKIYRRSSITEHPRPGDAMFRRLTVRGRADFLCSPDQTIGYAVNSLQDVFDRGLRDRLIIVPYYELTHYPVETISRVCCECGFEPFVCDPNNVEQITYEDDTVYGMSLHDVRPIVEPDRGGSWHGVLPDDLADFLNGHYGFIQSLASHRFLKGGKHGISTFITGRDG